MLNRLKALSRAAVAMLVLGCMAPLAAQGQESRITWRISQPAGNASEFSTQQEAVEAFKTLPVPPGVPAEYQHAWANVKTIKSKSVAFGGSVAITYWIGMSEPTDPEWTYNMRFETEAELIADFLQYDQNPSCPGRAMTPLGPWEEVFPGMEGRAELRHYRSTVMYGDNTVDYPCQASEGEIAISRMRRLNCPVEMTGWSDKYEACVNEDFVATITSKTVECDASGGGGLCGQGGGRARCDGSVGNPLRCENRRKV
ncbi:hypothetical protein [Stenotrophomonas cyclobalanopsidis]